MYIIFSGPQAFTCWRAAGPSLILTLRPFHIRLYGSHFRRPSHGQGKRPTLVLDTLRLLEHGQDCLRSSLPNTLCSHLYLTVLSPDLMQLAPPMSSSGKRGTDPIAPKFCPITSGFLLNLHSSSYEAQPGFGGKDARVHVPFLGTYHHQTLLIPSCSTLSPAKEVFNL